jgi:DNA-binding transcriptional ArsR family regulator
MSEIRFDVSDVADIRFVISPLWETVRSLYAVGDPGRHAVHLPWLRRVAGLAARPEVAVLHAYVRPRGWTPDFLTPPPAGPLVTFEQEIATLRATPPATVVADITATARRLPLTPVARAALDDPAAGLAALADAVEAWFAAAVAPDWPRIRALLESDIAHRSRQLAEGGARLLFDTLHPSVRWAGDRIVADDPWHLDLDLRGRGLPLLPSVFVDRRVLWTIRGTSAPLAVYPARAAGTLWETTPAAPDGLAAVLGPTRARLLSLLRGPATTAELARRLAISAPAVSQHLQALHAAGLVTRSRHGRQVLYTLTGVGTALLDAARTG